MRDGYGHSTTSIRGRLAWGAALLIGLTTWTVWAGPVAARVVPAGGSEMAVRYTATCTPEQLQFGTLQGYDTVHVEDALSFDAPGWPMLPALTVRIALPAGMRVTGLRVLSAPSQDLPGQYTLYPAQPPRRLSDVGPEDFIAPDAAAYASTAAYPAELAEFIHESDLAGQAFAEVRLHPVQYVAAERKLTLYTAIEVELEGVVGYVCGDYLPARISEEGRTELESLARSMVVNPEDVVLQGDANPPPQTLGVAAGDYDYVIITQSSWVTNFQALADWKTKKGKPATIVTTTWIYANYTGTNTEKIRAFVHDAYDNWGTSYVLLGGDVEYVPASSATFASIDATPIPNDTYYADFDDDWVCEVHVGRFPARQSYQIDTMASKMLTYEQNPPRTGYARTALFCGFDLSYTGSGEGEDLMTAVQSLYLPASWTYHSVYDSDPGTHRAIALAYLNQGHNLVNHSDHANTDVVGLGYVNHNEFFYKSDAQTLTNGARQSLFYTIGCWACDYNAATCVGEAFVRNASGGGYAFIGNSRYGFNAGSDGASAHFDRYFFRSIFSQGYLRVGTAFSNHKNLSYDGSDLSKYIFTELTLLGDPELLLLDDDPRDLVVTHPASLVAGQPNSFTVHVTSPGVSLPYAIVCLWKNGDVYQVGSIDGSGDASFTVTPASVGTLLVTASQRNFIPYQGSASVVPLQYTLAVSVAGQGSVLLNPPGGTYSAGSTVALTANAASGWRFDHWSDALSGPANPVNVVMDGDKTVTAVFWKFGDMNCDGAMNNQDIDGFVLALFDSVGYGTEYPHCSILNGDFTGDEAVNNQDIDGFVVALFGN